MVYETIVLEPEGSISVLKVNRPQAMNVLNRKVISELIAVLGEIEMAIMPKVVILTGTGEKAFVAGTDIIENGKRFLI